MLTQEQALAEAICIVNSAYVGLFTTVDAQGVPHARWMGSATTVDGVRRLFTLASKTSRKVAQVQQNPNVCWVFNSDHYADVVTLYGRAEVLSSPLAVQEVWDRLADAARAYGMRALADELDVEFVAVETVVRKIEFISPRRKIYQPLVVSF